MDQHESSGPSPSDVGRADRPLGRGLEDVSHVFLSQKADDGGVEPVSDRRLERPVPHEKNAPGTILLRPVTRVTREQVAAALREFEGALEPGLRGLDFGIRCGANEEIDLLAIDRASQLTIVDFDTTATDELLIRGLAHFDWILQNVPNLRRMFRGQPVNFSLEPRVVLLAPQFSSRIRSVTSQLTRPQVSCVRYHFVEAPGRVGIFFEPPSSSEVDDR